MKEFLSFGLFSGIRSGQIAKFLNLLVLVVICLDLSACSGSRKAPSPSGEQALQVASQVEQEYRIQVGDQLEIKFFYHPELNEQAVVRPDGRISLQLVKEVMAAGFTPAELTQLLSTKYSDELQKPELVVMVRSFGSQRIYVDGEVSKPGMIPLVGYVTVSRAISQAGGLKEGARTTDVVVIRHGAGNRPLPLTVNLQKVYDGTDLQQDIPLKFFDIVYVPRSHIANVNIWVDQYIRKNLPISLAFFYNFNP